MEVLGNILQTANNYLFKVDNRNTRKGVKYVQNKQ